MSTYIAYLMGIQDGYKCKYNNPFREYHDIAYRKAYIAGNDDGLFWIKDWWLD